MYADPESTIKIMLATDNHIGYNERDPVRGQDSINAFKEILQLAVKHDVSYESLARGVAFTLLPSATRSTSFFSRVTSSMRTGLQETACTKSWLCCGNTLSEIDLSRSSF